MSNPAYTSFTMFLLLTHDVKGFRLLSLKRRIGSPLFFIFMRGEQSFIPITRCVSVFYFMETAYVLLYGISQLRRFLFFVPSVFYTGSPRYFILYYIIWYYPLKYSTQRSKNFFILAIRPSFCSGILTTSSV